MKDVPVGWATELYARNINTMPARNKSKGPRIKKKPIRILLIEDNRLLREGIAVMLNEQADLHVVAALGGSGNTLLKARTTRPHVILLDLGLRNLNGVNLVAAIKKSVPNLKVIGMGLVPTQLDIVEFVQAGASGFILKNATVADFLKTIRSVAHGENVLPPPLTDSLFTHVVKYALNKGMRNVSRAVRMTKREREIVALIADGMSNKEIALRLNIATYTVKSHVHNIMEKMALHSRLQIALYSPPPPPPPPPLQNR
jgi:DNA-binding NarL/FixJ family response regulator